MLNHQSLVFLKCTAVRFFAVVALVCAVGLFSSSAHAQITFTVNSFTDDFLSITLNPGTLLTTGGPPTLDAVLFLFDGDAAANATWVNSDNPITGGGDFGSATLTPNAAANRNRPEGDYIVLIWNSDLSAAGNLTSPATFTVNATGAFTAANVTNWALYWGDPRSANAVLQFTGSTSAAAVPEPSTYAAVFGALALGLVAWRRRQAVATVA